MDTAEVVDRTNSVEQMREIVLAALSRLQSKGDTESSHEQADAIVAGFLMAAGFKDVADAFLAVPKWYA